MRTRWIGVRWTARTAVVALLSPFLPLTNSIEAQQPEARKVDPQRVEAHKPESRRDDDHPELEHAAVDHAAVDDAAVEHGVVGRVIALEAASLPVADYGLPDVGLLLSAGRRTPPGLTATRERERESERSAALRILEIELAADSESREDWMAAMGAILDSRVAWDGIWTVAAGAVAELGLYEFDQPLISVSESDAPPWVRLAAREAIARLYGSMPELNTEYRRPFEPGVGTRFLLDLLRERERSELAVRSELIALDVERAKAAIAGSNPELRRVAALVLADAVADGRTDAASVRVLLQQALSEEASAHAFHAELEALQSLATGLSPDAPAIASLRGFLLRRSGEAPGSFLLTLASGLASLPWTEGPERPEINLRAAQRHLSNILQRVTADPHGDVDVTSGVLAALENLLAHVEAVAADQAPEDGAWVRGAAARGPLLALLASTRVPDWVRRRAAGTLARVALQSDVQLLLKVLDDESTGSGLKYDLLGTLAALTEERLGDSSLVVERLFDFLEDSDADLRRRALTFLASPAIADYVRGSDLARIVDRLEKEPIQELKTNLLALLKQYGGREVLDPLLQHGSFDQLAIGDPAGVAELAETLARLAGGDSAALVASAKRLADVDDEDTRLVRLLRCLQLVAGLDQRRGPALEDSSHLLIVGWARAVRSAGVVLHDELQDGTRFLNSLLEWHLPAVVPGGSLSEAELAHTRAVFLSDAVALGELAREPEAYAQFERALRAAVNNREPFFAARVRRDRARFALARGNLDSALVDLSTLMLEEELGAVLDLSDLRTLASLLPRSQSTAGENAVELDAFDVLLGLVSRPTWRNELGAVRLRDLSDLADCAISSGDPTHKSTALALLANLPTGEAEPTPEANGATNEELPIWDGLDREPALLAPLREVVARLEVALKRVQ